VVIKGGPLEGDGHRSPLRREGVPRVPRKQDSDEEYPTGTGCTFASAIATLLASGNTVPEAVRKAKIFITQAIQAGLPLGKGAGPTNPMAYVLRENGEISRDPGIKKGPGLSEEREGRVPHSGGFGKPRVRASRYADGIEDVAAFPGRIVRFGDSVNIRGRSGIRSLPARGETIIGT